MEIPTQTSDDGKSRASGKVERPGFRAPRAGDGSAVHDLIARCPPLDANSLYCNLLQCNHFAETCVVAEANDEVVGWVSSYVRPDSPDCLFVWQVAVAPEARGQGLAAKMVRDILRRDACRAVTRLQSTITETNYASWSLFQKIADAFGARLERRPGFDAQTHFAGRNPTEYLVDIGPLHSGLPGG